MPLRTVQSMPVAHGTPLLPKLSFTRCNSTPAKPIQRHAHEVNLEASLISQEMLHAVFSQFFRGNDSLRDSAFTTRSRNSFRESESASMISSCVSILDTEYIDTAKFLTALQNTGILADDPRFKKAYHRLKESQRTSRHMRYDKFLEAVNPCVELLYKAVAGKLAIADFEEFSREMKKIFTICRVNQKGQNADYIPELRRCDPELWAASACTVDGQRYSCGDSGVPFTLQSASKPFCYALALSECGTDYVHEYVGAEPSGHHFNAITLNHKQQPHNPLINAGAIMVIAMMHPDKSLGCRYDWVKDELRRAVGGLYQGFNQSACLSEKSGSDRNHALAYFLKENGAYPKEARSKFLESLELYFMICSMELTVESGAVLAGTLANGGVCPITGEQVFKQEHVRNVLSLMLTCGMTSQSGEFAFHVGVPAKSGISGVVLMVIPNLCGFCVYSPRVDKANSCRGMEFCRRFVKRFNLHQYDILLDRHSESQNGSLDPSPRRMSLATFLQYTPLESDCDGPYEIPVEVLISSLFFAAKSNDIATFRKYYLNGSNLGAVDFQGRTALHVAAAEGHLAIVRFLVKVCKLDCKLKNWRGDTALDNAKFFGHTKTIAFLECSTG